MSIEGTTKAKPLQLEDVSGGVYQRRELVARGGQGVVYKTDRPKVLIKGFTNKDETARKRWREHIEWLIRQDIADLKLARPLTLLKEPRVGYVMELMEGLVPLKQLLDSYIDSASNITEEDAAPHIRNYLDQGGLRRRIRILCQLARTLNQLHGRGMLYGDISPDNIFISDAPEHAETWLIDCDNINFESSAGVTICTPDYGAPEVVRGEAVLSSLTDCWSFAVVAYQLLTHNHPLKGDLVNDGEPELEHAALQGDLPWINDDDSNNECSANLPVLLIEHSKLPRLFQQTFGPGKHAPHVRPGMAEWLEAFTEVDERLFVCHRCGGHSLLPAQKGCTDGVSCFFCDASADERLVVFEEFICVSEQDAQEKHPDFAPNTFATGRQVCLQPGDAKELKRLMPSFSYDKVPSDHIRLEYTETFISIIPVEPLHISRGKGQIKEFSKGVRLSINLRGQHLEPYCIHLGNPKDTHVFWQFRW